MKSKRVKPQTQQRQTHLFCLFSRTLNSQSEGFLSPTGSTSDSTRSLGQRAASNTNTWTCRLPRVGSGGTAAFSLHVFQMDRVRKSERRRTDGFSFIHSASTSVELLLIHNVCQRVCVCVSRPNTHTHTHTHTHSTRPHVALKPVAAGMLKDPLKCVNA